MSLHRVADYTLTRELGRGGMGAVFEALSPAGATVALKTIMWPELGDSRARWEAIERFQREARAARSLRHPNICQVLDFGAHQDALFIVMEFLDGDTLRELIRLAGAIKVERAVEIVGSVCEALAYAHDRRVVHRDIKPENIMMLHSGKVKLTDFGLASVVHEATLTDPGALMGTLCYMSPEQVRGEPVDARSDLFSLGATFYEMLTGVRAFAAEERAAVLHQILSSDPPPATGLPARVSEALQRCLRKQPGERFQNAREMLACLTGQAAESRAAREPPARELAPAPMAQVSDARTPTPPPTLPSPEAEEADVRARANYRWAPDLKKDTDAVEIREDAFSARTVEDGAYVLTSGQGETWGNLRAPERTSDFVFEAHITRLAVPDYTECGLIYGREGAVCVVGCSDYHGVRIAGIVSRLGVPQTSRSATEFTLKVVRRAASMHVFVNGEHVLTGEHFGIRVGRFSVWVGWEGKAAFRDLRIEGVDLRLVVEKAEAHWRNFETREARLLLRHAALHDPDLRSAYRRLQRTWPDRRDTVVIVIGSGLAEQLNDRTAAGRLQDEITKRAGGHDTRGAVLVTDAAVLAEEKIMECPLIAIGIPGSNAIVARLEKELPRDLSFPSEVCVHHDLPHGGRRAAVWATYWHLLSPTADAVESFISSGLLDRFLDVVWGSE